MTTENTAVQPVAPVSMELATNMEFARALASADLLPPAFRGKPANVLLAVELGKALGLAPIVAIQQINVISGKPSLGADLVASLVRHAGHTLRVGMVDDTTAKCVIVRKDDPGFEFTSVWTMDRAKQAGLTGKDSWRNYPQNMLRKRAITECARDACPEALAGIGYDPEELEPADAVAGGSPVMVTTSEIKVPTVTRSVPLDDPAPTDIVDAETGELVPLEDTEPVDE